MSSAAGNPDTNTLVLVCNGVDLEHIRITRFGKTSLPEFQWRKSYTWQYSFLLPEVTIPSKKELAHPLSRSVRKHLFKIEYKNWVFTTYNNRIYSIALHVGDSLVVDRVAAEEVPPLEIP